MVCIGGVATSLIPGLELGQKKRQAVITVRKIVVVEAQRVRVNEAGYAAARRQKVVCRLQTL